MSAAVRSGCAASGDPLAPFVPTREDPFDLRKAGHLLRRAGFGGSLAERREIVRLGPEAAVALLSGSGAGEEVDEVLEDVLAAGGLEQVRAYRVWRMLRGRRRLAERMSLFWHDHFATSNQKVRSPRMMARQLATFDRLGLGRFDDLLLEVSRDPAMVRWLDNETNVRGKANENYARELFELFALGEGHYSERDVQEAARAFTGWHLARERFRFRRAQHDGGEKEVFGRRGRLTGEDVVAMAAAHPASAPFLARKLLAFFVHPEPTEGEVAALAEVYRREGRSIGATLGVLLRSRLFFGPRAYRSMVKSPADYVVGLVRSLGADAAPRPLARAMARMGQALLEPPNVAGWKGGRAWITSASWLLRSNFAADLFSRRIPLAPGPGEILGGGDPAASCERAFDLLFDGDVSAAGRDSIRGLAERHHDPVQLLHAVQCLPEGQML